MLPKIHPVNSFASFWLHCGSFFILIVFYFVFVNSNCNGFATAKYNINRKSEIKPQQLCKFSISIKKSSCYIFCQLNYKVTLLN